MSIALVIVAISTLLNSIVAIMIVRWQARENRRARTRHNELSQAIRQTMRALLNGAPPP